MKENKIEWKLKAGQKYSQTSKRTRTRKMACLTSHFAGFIVYHMIIEALWSPGMSLSQWLSYLTLACCLTLVSLLSQSCFCRLCRLFSVHWQLHTALLLGILQFYFSFISLLLCTIADWKCAICLLIDDLVYISYSYSYIQTASSVLMCNKQYFTA